MSEWITGFNWVDPGEEIEDAEEAQHQAWEATNDLDALLRRSMKFSDRWMNFTTPILMAGSAVAGAFLCLAFR